MQFKLVNIRIYTDKVNKPGSQFDGQEYSWLRAQMYDEDNENPRQLPYKFIFDERKIAKYKECATPDPQSPGTFIVNENDLQEKHPELTHVGLMFQHIETTLVPVARIHTRDIYNSAGQLIAKKGDWVTDKNGNVFPTTTITMWLQKKRDRDLPNQTPDQMAWVETPAQYMERVMQHSYRIYDGVLPGTPAATPTAPEAPEAPAQSPEEEAAALRAKLAALGQQ